MKKNITAFIMCLMGIGLILGDAPYTLAQETASEEFTLVDISITAGKMKIPRPRASGH